MTERTIAPASSPQRSAFRHGRRYGRLIVPQARRTDFVFPRDGYRLALYAMVIFSISRIHQFVGPLAALRPGLVTAMLALGFAVINPSALCYASMRTRPARYMLALVIMACISVPFGISIGGSGKFLLDTYFRVVLAYVLVALALGTPRHLSQFIWAWVLSCGILAFMAIFVFNLSSVGGMARLGGLYMYDANDLGLILVMGVPLALVAIETSGSLGRLVGGVILLSCGVALARSGSRGAFVGLVILVPAFLVVAKHIAVHKRVLAVAVLAGGLIFAAPFGYWEQMSSLSDPTADYNWEAEQGRRKVALRGLGYMADNPLTGLGVDNFRKAEWTISEMAQDDFRERGIKGSAAHNTWLQAGAEMGVPGLILWVLLVFGTMMAVVRERMRLPRSWRSGDRDQRLLYSLATNLPLSILAFAVISTFVSFAYLDPMYYLVAMSAGLIVSIRRKQAQIAAVLRIARPE